KIGRERPRPDHETVIPGGLEGVRQAGEQAAAIVVNAIHFTVHKLHRPDDVAAGGLSDGLMAEADAEDRELAGERLDRRAGDARLLRRARAGRNDQVRRPAPLNLIDRDLIVPMHLKVDGWIDLANSLNEVVSERIVVVD